MAVFTPALFTWKQAFNAASVIWKTPSLAHKEGAQWEMSEQSQSLSQCFDHERFHTEHHCQCCRLVSISGRVCAPTINTVMMQVQKKYFCFILSQLDVKFTNFSMLVCVHFKKGPSVKSLIHYLLNTGLIRNSVPKPQMCATADVNLSFPDNVTLELWQNTSIVPE